MEEEICGRVVYHYREEEGEEEDSPRFASFCGKSEKRLQNVCVCVYEKKKKKKKYRERERERLEKKKL